MRTILAQTLAPAVLLALGCNNPPPATPDAGPRDDGGTPMVDACTTCGTDSGPPDAGPEPDGNDTFATATPITVDAEDGTPGVLNPPGDLDYYSFTGTAGQWVEIDTFANPDDNPDMVDVVVVLYDSSMQRIAENDDSLPRTNTDSHLITRLPADGTYYVLVEEWSTWAEEPDEGGPTFEYGIAIAALDASDVGFNIDAEGGDDAASAQTLTEFLDAEDQPIGYSIVAGDFDDETDVDVYSFTVRGDAQVSVEAHVMPSGDTGIGSAAAPARVWITSEAADAPIIGRVDPSVTPSVEPSLGPGTYHLYVEHGASSGASSFYVVKLFVGDGENPLEMNDAENNSPTTPEPITFAAEPNLPEGVTARRKGFILANVGDSDMDHFSIEVAAGELVTVTCGSASLGSGVVDLEVALLNADGSEEVTAVTEDPMDGALIDDEAVPAGGIYLVRLSKTSQADGVTGDWVRCGFYLDTPAP